MIFNGSQDMLAKAQGYDNPAHMQVMTDSNAVEGPDYVGQFFGDFWHGIKNWWYANTGRAYLTDDAKHAEEREDTAYQRGAADMEAAGLSKYAGVTPAESSSYASQGPGLLSSAMALQNLRSASISNREAAYNFDKAQEWGVPTTSVDQVAKYDALAKVLFGKSIHDIVGEGGLFGALFGDNSGSSGPSDSPTSDGINQGAYSDQAERVFTTMSQLSGGRIPFAPSLIDPRKGLDIPTTSSGSPEVLGHDQFEMDNNILRSYRDSLWDMLGSYAVGQPRGLSINKICSYYSDQLVKEGFDKDHARELVSSWAKQDMYDLGYSFDSKDKLWYHDHY